MGDRLSSISFLGSEVEEAISRILFLHCLSTVQVVIIYLGR